MLVIVENIEQAVNKLSIKKAAGIDGITFEHILYSHPCLIVHLKLLFHMMLLHGYVPNNFGLGIVVPILKDKNGDQTSIDNYRPVTLSPTISKIFESVLLMNYGNYLYSDDRQFGFKKTMGCRNAIFAVRNVINYFNERGSNVFIASLDAAKAFDRVNHFKLYTSLMKRNIPTAFLNVVINWYSKMNVIVRWNNSLSAMLRVKSGVRQGGVLSPYLFNVYADVFIKNIVTKNVGCHIGHTCMACMMYADDILLMSASLAGLQELLDECVLTSNEICLKFNEKKSHCIIIGPHQHAFVANVVLCGTSLMWENSIKYLGIDLMAGSSFEVDLDQVRGKFFVSANSINI